MKHWKDALHPIYRMAGHAVCWLFRCRTVLCDRISPPDSDSILFVSHPDDDALFFHTFLVSEKPYVVLLFTGWSLRRLPDFFKAMKHYGVRCRAYSEVSEDTRHDEKRLKRTEKRVRSCLKIGSFSRVLTHNASGEYGHHTHRMVHQAVVASCRGDEAIYCPVDRAKIERYPLGPEALKEKEYVFTHIYRSEAWVMTDEAAGTPVWFTHERLEKIQ